MTDIWRRLAKDILTCSHLKLKLVGYLGNTSPDSDAGVFSFTMPENLTDICDLFQNEQEVKRINHERLPKLQRQMNMYVKQLIHSYMKIVGFSNQMIHMLLELSSLKKIHTPYLTSNYNLILNLRLITSKISMQLCHYDFHSNPPKAVDAAPKPLAMIYLDPIDMRIKIIDSKVQYIHTYLKGESDAGASDIDSYFNSQLPISATVLNIRNLIDLSVKLITTKEAYIGLAGFPKHKDVHLFDHILNSISEVFPFPINMVTPSSSSRSPLKRWIEKNLIIASTFVARQRNQDRMILGNVSMHFPLRALNLESPHVPDGTVLNDQRSAPMNQNAASKVSMFMNIMLGDTLITIQNGSFAIQLLIPQLQIGLRLSEDGAVSENLTKPTFFSQSIHVYVKIVTKDPELTSEAIRNRVELLYTAFLFAKSHVHNLNSSIEADLGHDALKELGDMTINYEINICDYRPILENFLVAEHHAQNMRYRFFANQKVAKAREASKLDAPSVLEAEKLILALGFLFYRLEQHEKQNPFLNQAKTVASKLSGMNPHERFAAQIEVSSGRTGQFLREKSYVSLPCLFPFNCREETLTRQRDNPLAAPIFLLKGKMIVFNTVQRLIRQIAHYVSLLIFKLNLRSVPRKVTFHVFVQDIGLSASLNGASIVDIIVPAIQMERSAVLIYPGIDASIFSDSYTNEPQEFMFDIFLSRYYMDFVPNLSSLSFDSIFRPWLGGSPGYRHHGEERKLLNTPLNLQLSNLDTMNTNLLSAFVSGLMPIMPLGPLPGSIGVARSPAKLVLADITADQVEIRISNILVPNVMQTISLVINEPIAVSYIFKGEAEMIRAYINSPFVFAPGYNDLSLTIQLSRSAFGQLDVKEINSQAVFFEMIEVLLMGSPADALIRASLGGVAFFDMPMYFPSREFVYGPVDLAGDGLLAKDETIKRFYQENCSIWSLLPKVPSLLLKGSNFLTTLFKSRHVPRIQERKQQPVASPAPNRNEYIPAKTELSCFPAPQPTQLFVIQQEGKYLDFQGSRMTESVFNQNESNALINPAQVHQAIDLSKVSKFIEKYVDIQNPKRFQLNLLSLYADISFYDPWKPVVLNSSEPLVGHDFGFGWSNAYCAKNHLSDSLSGTDTKDPYVFNTNQADLLRCARNSPEDGLIRIESDGNAYYTASLRNVRVTSWDRKTLALLKSLSNRCGHVRKLFGSVSVSDGQGQSVVHDLAFNMPKQNMFSDMFSDPCGVHQPCLSALCVDPGFRFTSADPFLPNFSLSTESLDARYSWRLHAQLGLPIAEILSMSWRPGFFIAFDGVMKQVVSTDANLARATSLSPLLYFDLANGKLEYISGASTEGRLTRTSGGIPNAKDCDAKSNWLLEVYYDSGIKRLIVRMQCKSKVQPVSKGKTVSSMVSSMVSSIISPKVAVMRYQTVFPVNLQAGLNGETTFNFRVSKLFNGAPPSRDADLKIINSDAQPLCALELVLIYPDWSRTRVYYLERTSTVTHAIGFFVLQFFDSCSNWIKKVPGILFVRLRLIQKYRFFQNQLDAQEAPYITSVDDKHGFVGIDSTARQHHERQPVSFRRHFEKAFSLHYCNVIYRREGIYRISYHVPYPGRYAIELALKEASKDESHANSVLDDPLISSLRWFQLPYYHVFVRNRL